MIENTIIEDRIEGQPCKMCYGIVSRIEVVDLRMDWEKEKYPLKEDEKTIFWCRCNHGGDCMVGGFF